MKQPHVILTYELKKIDLKYWEGKPLISYFDKVRSFLSQRKGEAIADVISEPNIRKGSDQICWIATSSKDSIFPLGASSDNELERKGEALLQELLDFAAQLKKAKEEEEKGWGRLLSFILEEVSPENLFTDGEKFFLASWGIESLGDGQSGAFATGLTPTSKKPAVSESSEKPEGTNPNQEPSLEPEDTSVERNSSTETSSFPKEDTPEFEYDNEDKTESEEGIKGEEEIKDDNTVISNSGKGRFSNNWWMFLLALLALILLFVWLKGCGSEPAILPPSPVLPPVVDSTDVGYNSDSLAFIVKNKVNVVISSDQTIKEFAEKFDEVYPDRQRYKIVYYGEESIKRVQIEVPEEEREDMIKEIPEKFPDFRLLVYEEGLLQSNIYPSDPLFSNTDFKWYFDAINAPAAWNKSWGNDKVVVAILDDGFDLNHSEFTGKVVAPFNVYKGNTNVSFGNGGKHGTHVAGTAVGNRENGAGLSGIAPDCLLMPVQVADGRGLISQTAVVDGILYAINQGAHVINMSLGMVVPPHIAVLPVGMQRDIAANSMKSQEAFWKRLFQIADENNVTVVMAAGNQNVLIGLDPMARSGYTINVSATDKRKLKASFSNFGPLSTISAPGVQIYNSTPGNRYEFLQGTSMAAPIVTGGVALLKSINPDLTNEEIIELLVRTGTPLSEDIGPLLQLDRAIGVTDSTGVNIPNDEFCEEVKGQIDSLLAELERLRELCPEAFEQDTMQIPDVIEDLNFSLGVWESTTYLTNESNEKVTIRFEFRPGGIGDVRFVEENGLVYDAGLSLSHTVNTFDIDQLNKATNPSSEKEYYRYSFNCQADANGKASCWAQNKTISANKFNFRLIKIR